MGLIFYKAKLSDFSSENTLRNDLKYINSLSKLDTSFYTYKDIFDFVSYSPTNLDELETFLYAEIGDVSKIGDVFPNQLSFFDRNEENESLFKKIEKGDIIRPQKGDILISKIRPYLNKNVLIGDEEIFFTKAFIHIRPKINSEILYFAIRTIFYDQINAVSRQGKGYPTLKEEDLKSIRFSKQIIDYFIRNEKEILSQINFLKAEITNLKNSKLKPLDIINQVFGEEFEFDWKTFETIKKEKSYYSSLLNYSKNIDCRFGFRFQHKSGTYLMDFLKQKTTKRVKNFLKIPISLGASISPSQYDEDGNYYYISMATVKKYFFDQNDAQKVSIDYSNENLNKTVQINDIIMTRSGMAIGKFALIEEDIEGVYADFTMRIRLHNFSPLLAYYYFRSDFFQHLIKTHKKGLQNHNIFPSQIQEFPIPDWNKAKQAKIVEKIKTQIDAQNVIDLQIEQKQQQINEIIEKAIFKH
jgi:type I restriction enzyme, S subunit